MVALQYEFSSGIALTFNYFRSGIACFSHNEFAMIVKTRTRIAPQTIIYNLSFSPA